MVSEPEGGWVIVLVVEPVQIEVTVEYSKDVSGTKTITVPVVSEPAGGSVTVPVMVPVQVEVKVSNGEEPQRSQSRRHLNQQEKSEFQ